MMIILGNRIKTISLVLSLVLFNIYLVLFYCIYISDAMAQGLKGAIDLSWEEREIENRRTRRFVQVYDLILNRELVPLYDTSVKMQFRSESFKGGIDTKNRKTEVLPVLNINLGNPMTSLGLGWSMDNIDYERGSYINERIFSTFRLTPKRLPRLLFQYWSEDKERTNESVLDKQENNLFFKEDYTVKIGFLNIEHTYQTNRKDRENELENSYGLANKVWIGRNFSFLAKKLDLYTRYEFNHKTDKDDERDNTTLGNNGNIYFDYKHNPKMNTRYRFVFDYLNESDPENNEKFLINDLTFLYKLHPFLFTEIGGGYDRFTRSVDESARYKTDYSFKLIPDIIGLLLGPNDHDVYPVDSEILIIRSSEKFDSGNKARIFSLLLKSSTTLYKGINIKGELGSRKTNYSFSESNSLGTWFYLFLNLKLQPKLSGSIKHKNEWIKYYGADRAGREFDGEIETSLSYNPVQTFLISLGTTLDYGREDSSYDFHISWTPKNKKTEINLQYESGDEEENESFLGQFNYNLSKAIQLRLQYQHPSHEQKQLIKFTINF